MPESESEVDWDDVRDLATRVFQKGERLALTSEVIAVLRRCAREVAIADEETEAALASVESATTLLWKIREDRIRKGSDRLGDALLRMYKLRDDGDLEGARQQMRDVLAVEVVPHYRNIAQGQLDMLDDWEADRKP